MAFQGEDDRTRVYALPITPPVPAAGEDAIEIPAVVKLVECQDQQLDELYQALSSTTRRRIVSMLAQSPKNISELVPAFDMTLAAVSKHVKLLERAGIVHCEQRGRVHVCRLVPDGLNRAHAWLQGYEHFWQARLDAFERALAEDGADDEG